MEPQPVSLATAQPYIPTAKLAPTPVKATPVVLPAPYANMTVAHKPIVLPDAKLIIKTIAAKFKPIAKS